ncbi:MAG: class II aldolase/adducin family protein [Acidiferrobacterales bacterium]|nr:class II aldolase/adducin family protein [Acidiferrobacterales bacterium]
MNLNSSSPQSMHVVDQARTLKPDHEQQLRVDLAACFRMVADQGWSESTANHFSVAVSDDGKQFLMNPKWRHFALIKASELQLFDANNPNTLQSNNAPDPSAWCIHSKIHSAVPGARALLHCHPPYATALAGLLDPSIKPIDQNTAKFFNRVAIDLEFDGLADNEDEGLRIANTLGGKKVLMMGNHGVSVIGESIQEAFEDLYYLERACCTMILAYQTGQPLNIMSDNLAEKTAKGWDRVRQMAYSHFDQYKELLNRTDSSYAD